MKKALSFLIGFWGAVASVCAQSDIILYVYVPQQQEAIPAASESYLANSLCSAITEDGLAAQSDYVTQFLLVPKINVETKNIVAGPQQQFAFTLNVALQVIDNVSGTIYATTNVTLRGVGTNETKAYNSAFRTLSKSHAAIRQLAAKAKPKILAYYEAEADGIIRRARALAHQKKYEEAFYLLSMIPTQCSKYDAALAAEMEIWDSYEGYACGVNIGRARAVWTANQSVEAANVAGTYLATILPDAPCYGEALQLYEEIKQVVGDRWDFAMKMYEDKNALRMAKIEAIKAIGVAFGEGQQPEMVIHKSIY